MAPQGRPCVLPPFLSSEADMHMPMAVAPLQTVKGHALSKDTSGDFNVTSVFFLSANRCFRFYVIFHFNISSAPILVSLENN